MRCGWCHGDGCKVCREPKRPYFPPKKKSAFDDRLNSGHKHNCHSVVSSHSTYEWWECSCGHIYKIEVR